jgi:hypothetical protein
MPSPGVVNNPGGSNSYQSSQGHEEPYGAIERRKVLTRLSPMEKNPALNAPRQAQAKAVKGKPEAPVQPHAAQAQELNDAATRGQPEQPQDPVAQFWQMLASEKGASPLIRSYAEQAMAGR